MMQLLRMFPDEEEARHYIESRRWPNGPRCPVCGSDRIGQHSAGLYRCNDCQQVFSVRTGTILHRSHVGLRHWLHALSLLATGEPLTSTALARAIGIRQPTCWAMLRRIEPAIKRLAGIQRGALDELVDRLLAYRPAKLPARGPRRKKARTPLGVRA